ncbi:FtsK/SpoIIIE domain-containing protein, partial [Mycolicibacterium fortuitum]|uniref:FtsK/SpoIIIE domain-containing protein n=2 Tax=Mycobacteriaceae TaxID=1762 RepID=UPI0024201AB4
IPITMPGGSINADRVDSNNRPQILRSRVLVPISERIQPDGEANGMPSFKICDYSARIEEVGVQARTAAASQAPAIHQVPNIFAYSTLIEAYKHIDYSKVRRGARVLPMGVDRATSQPLALELAQASHMFVAGTGHAGVTTTLRTAINSVTAMYTPDEATVVIIDEK